MSRDTTLVELEVVEVLAGVDELDEPEEPPPPSPQADTNVISDTRVINLPTLSFNLVPLQKFVG